jgi:hypothetical protein
VQERGVPVDGEPGELIRGTPRSGDSIVWSKSNKCINRSYGTAAEKNW